MLLNYSVQCQTERVGVADPPHLALPAQHGAAVSRVGHRQQAAQLQRQQRRGAVRVLVGAAGGGALAGQRQDGLVHLAAGRGAGRGKAVASDEGFKGNKERAGVVE